MYIPSDSNFRASVLRIFVKNSEDGSAEPYTRIVQVTREGGDIRIDLPEASDALETGWFPEIVQRFGSEADTLDLVVTPKWPPAPTQTLVHAQTEADDAPARTSPPVAKSQPIFPGLREGEAPEQLPPPPDEVLFEITFIKREIRLNRSVICKPNYDSENELVFDYLYRHPNNKVQLSEIEAEIRRPVHKRLSEIVRDLGFRKELRTMFFPDVSKSAIRFVNPITRADFQQRRLRLPRISVM